MTMAARSARLIDASPVDAGGACHLRDDAMPREANDNRSTGRARDRRTSLKLQDTLAYPPRGMNIDRAAAYVGLSTSKFMELVDANDAPAPLDLGGCPRWDRRKLDDWLDAKSEYVKRSSHKKTVADLLEAQLGNAQAEVRQ